MEKRNIRLIALDMDGTTLQEDGTLSEANRSVLEKAISQGIHVVISTGRTCGALPPVMRDFPGVRYAITSNGAAVIDLQEDKWLYKNEISAEAIEILLHRLEGSDFYLEAFVNGVAYMDEAWTERVKEYGLPEQYVAYALRSRKPIPDLIGFMRKQNGIENVNVNFGDPKVRLQWKRKLWDIPGTTLTTSFPHNWELGGEGAGKGDGLEALSRQLDISPEEVMAIGDNENDLSMIRFAGCGVAMGNALNVVKAEADVVTSDYREDGVAKAISQIVFGETI